MSDEVGQDSQWLEPDPEGVAATRVGLYIAQDGSGRWGFEADRREADGWIAQDSSGEWGVDTSLDTGGYVVQIGGLAGVKV